MSNLQHQYCVILAGGVGSRLWPTSRQNMPKQFLDVLGTGESLLQMTYKRFLRFIPESNILVVTNRMYADIVKDQIQGLPQENLLLEPMRRGTIPSVALAAFALMQRDEEASMVISPSDQLIRDYKQFEADVMKALDYASKNERILAMGVMPSRPETTFGYIQVGDIKDDNIFSVKSFTEKPELNFARMFVEEQEFVWNTGVFVAAAKTYIQTLDASANFYEAMMRDVEGALKKGKDLGEVVERNFCMCPNISLEQGLLEKTGKTDVMLCHFDWTDIGSWNSLYRALNKTENESDESPVSNVVCGAKALLYDCNGCIVKAPENHVVVAQGLDGYMIVEAGNVIVVCKKDDQKSIRKFVNDVQVNLTGDFV